MSNTFGENIKVSIFGQSHSDSIGVTFDSPPAGFKIDFDALSSFMKRRSPNNSVHSTKRKEGDEITFISGLVDGITCGAPLCGIIKNGDARSLDYDNIKNTPRPAHADYTSFLKHGAYRDYRGGGEFSGRLTAPLCIAGGICIQLLGEMGIEIVAHVLSVGNVYDKNFTTIDNDDRLLTEVSYLKALPPLDIPTLDPQKGERMLSLIEAVREEGDSIGAVVECVILNPPAGIGSPMFGGVENRISQCVFAVPAVKGIEFGAGFKSVALKGSENNDSFFLNNTNSINSELNTNNTFDALPIKTKTNNHGGILGGITSGMPIIFRAAFKPTPSISRPQHTVDISGLCESILTIKGRHDPCIGIRAVPVIEAAAAIAIYDMIVGNLSQ